MLQQSLTMTEAVLLHLPDTSFPNMLKYLWLQANNKHDTMDKWCSITSYLGLQPNTSLNKTVLLQGNLLESLFSDSIYRQASQKSTIEKKKLNILRFPNIDNNMLYRLYFLLFLIHYPNIKIAAKSSER